jgi:hypothetical protein
MEKNLHQWEINSAVQTGKSRKIKINQGVRILLDS